MKRREFLQAAGGVWLASAAGGLAGALGGLAGASDPAPLEMGSLFDAHRHSTGGGHVYQGRSKSFPVQEDEHFYAVCRDVERNALRANLAGRAEAWRWGSLHRWKGGTGEETSLLASWPLPRRRAWFEYVNAPQTEAELAALRRCVQRGCPYGESWWCAPVVHRFGLESTRRPQGRPKRRKNGS